MIKLIAALLGGKMWLAWLVVAWLGLGAVGGVYAWVDHQGYKRATLEWTVKYNTREAELTKQRFAELDRQATANSDAKAREAAALAAERERADALADLLADLERAADADPNRDKLGIGADSVDRINRIR